MNDLIKLVFAQIPKYLSNFVNLLSGPKRFVRKKNKYNDQLLTEAITFLAISFVLGLILKSPFIPENINYWQHVAVRGMTDLIEVTLFSAVLRFSWRCVGGHASFGRLLITLCYFYAVGIIISDIFNLLSFGVVKFWDPQLYALLVSSYKNKGIVTPQLVAYVTQAAEAANSGNFRNLLVFAGFELTVLGGFLAVLVWIIVGWGAFRELAGLSKRKSFLAGMIFLPLGAIVLAFTYFVFFPLLT